MRRVRVRVRNLRSRSLAPGEEQDQLRVEQISFLLKGKILVSFQEKRSDFFTHIRERIKTHSGIVRKSPAGLVHLSCLRRRAWIAVCQMWFQYCARVALGEIFQYSAAVHRDGKAAVDRGTQVATGQDCSICRRSCDFCWGNFGFG